MSVVKPFANNTLATFVYEPFSYTISNPGSYTLTVSNSSGIPPGYIVNAGTEIIFSTPSNGMTAGATAEFVITAVGADPPLVSSNVVTVGAGRFLDASGASYVGQSFACFKNEPIAPIRLVAPLAISTPTSVPTLPPGLIYTSNASNIYSITGTPLVTVPQSNYLVIGTGTGSNVGKIVTSQFGLSVSNERIQMNLVGSPIVSPMTVGTPISQRILTSQYPPYPSGGTLRYTWSGVPDGITVADASGTTRFSPFTPTDPLATLTIQGTPTIAAANAYANAGITSNVVAFTATRTNPLPQLSNSTAVTFGFGEAVLFDSVTVPTLYSGVVLDPSATFFRAQTYFSTGTGTGIASILSPDLRGDLSLNFVPATGRAYLTGSPGTTGTASYTIRATNSNAITRDLVVPITVATDTVSFVSPTPAVDVCYNFVLSRPISLDLSGYYTSPIQFRAIAASGNTVTFSTSGLAGTGLSLTNTAQLVGTPESVTALSTVTVTANVTGTPATASTTFKSQILNDVVTFSQPTALQLSFIQNRAITPIQFTATTLSGRSVISWSSSTLPPGLAISTTGLLTGTPVSTAGGTFTLNASTGYMSMVSSPYSYTLTPDSALLLTSKSSYSYAPLETVSISIQGLTYSGLALSNYTFSGFSPTYGVSLGSTTGQITGTWQSGIPPDPLFPTSPVSFSITADAGTLHSTLPSTFTVTNPVVSRSFLLVDELSNMTSAQIYTNDDDTYATWTTRATGGTSLSLKNTSVDSNVYLLPSGGDTYRRSTDGVTWASLTLSSGGLYTTLYAPAATKWYGAGSLLVGSNLNAALFTSSDDGVNWTLVSTTGNAPRVSSQPNYFTSQGVAFGSNSGVLVMGGSPLSGSSTIQRSTNDGTSWRPPTLGDFGIETCDLELTDSRWVAAGSSVYSTTSNYESFPTTAVTLKWSDDQGDKWNDAGGTGLFDVTATQVVSSGGRWLATGLIAGAPGTTQPVKTGLSYSDDGKTWTPITLPGITFTDLFASVGLVFPLPEINDIWFDATNWYVLVKLQDGATYPATILQHSLTGDLTTGWITKATPSTLSTQTYAHGFKTNYVRLGIPTTLTLGFSSFPPGGPTVTAPSQRSYTLYQYVTIDPIVFVATGTGTVYYFVVSSQLPLGLTFDPVTATISGASMRLGQTAFTVYAKDNVGVTQIPISVNTILPVVQKQQTSAGAWTSLVRQYTVVNAAQNSVNGKVLPATESALGEFLSPEPPDSVSAPGDPNCVKC